MVIVQFMEAETKQPVSIFYLYSPYRELTQHLGAPLAELCSTDRNHWVNVGLFLDVYTNGLLKRKKEETKENRHLFFSLDKSQETYFFFLLGERIEEEFLDSSTT